MSADAPAVETASGQRPGWRAMISIAAIVGLGDLTLYRGLGYFGPAVFFPIACSLLLVGSRGQMSMLTAAVSLLMLVVSAGLAWSGSVSQILVAIWLLNAFAMTLQGITPYLLESIVFFASTIPGGYEFLHDIELRWRRKVLDPIDQGRPSQLVNVMMPLLTVLIFGTIFVFANPNLIASISRAFGNVLDFLKSWTTQFSPGEVVFWCGIAWFSAGLLRPFLHHILDFAEVASDESRANESQYYSAFRNTLIAVIVLFAVYLTFEFFTLWFRKFPTGFHYSGYAHQGAAWLTAALALATVVLSLMFRGTMMKHPQLPQLKRLAGIWSGLNLLLAASVYNRLLIYIDFNGMTRMRVVGLLGITAVVGGFLLVLLKIAKRRSFHWLIRHQLLLPAMAVFLYVAVPVDALVHRYNVSQILAGHPEPSVQISEHPIDEAALPVLIPLLESDDEVIREGVRSILSSALSEMNRRQVLNVKHWTARQFGTERAMAELNNIPSLTNQSSISERDRAREQFRKYSLQWW